MLQLPERLGGRYRVGAAIGHGAIAEVVRAVDEATGRDVALKVLYPALRESPVVVGRFRREVELGQRIRHSHVLSLHEVVESDGFLFLVMEHHGGGDLADLLARQPAGRLQPVEIAALARQLGGALAAAHRVGIVHRDVKPSNVLVGTGADSRPPELDVRLCDFGLARSAEGSGLTTSAAVLGTPEYMAPEVIAEGHADPRSDLYSLGVVLFEVATGRLPFLASSPYQLMRQHLEEEPVRARSLAPDLPPFIDDAIARALAKDPLDRFQSADELVAAVAGPSATGAMARALAVRVPPAATRRGPPCPACGGWVVESAALCADCGHRMLRLEHEPRGASILVTGPGEIGDQLDARKHVALYRLLGELPATGGAPLVRQARAPRFPFYVARHLTTSSAEELLARVKGLGLEGRIVRGWALGPREMRKKVNTLSWRIFAGLGAASWASQLHHLMPDGIPAPLRYGFMPALFLAVPAVLAVRLARSSGQPLVGRVGVGDGAAALDALVASMVRLTSRQDRRLLGRIADRLSARPEDAGKRALIDRADRLAAALAAAEDADRHTAQTATDPAHAQAELRRLERGRVLLRAELLRLGSLLEAEAGAAASPGAEAGAAGSQAARSALEALEALDLELEARSELEALLAGTPARRPPGLPAGDASR